MIVLKSDASPTSQDKNNAKSRAVSHISRAEFATNQAIETMTATPPASNNILVSELFKMHGGATLPHDGIYAWDETQPQLQK